jgi:hypothetical protein
MLEGANSRKATSTIKSALDVLRGQTQASVHRTMRVANPRGGQRVNIAVTQIWINATAPVHAIAQFQGMSSLSEVISTEEEEEEEEE